MRGFLHLTIEISNNLQEKLNEIASLFIQKKPLNFFRGLLVLVSTRSGNRTHTPKYTSLSRARLPIPPSGHGKWII